MIKQYIKNNKKLYMINNLYLGINPITGKEVRKTKRGFESKKEAEIYIARLKVDFEKGLLFVSNKKHSFEDIYNLWLEEHKNTIKESSLNTYYKISKLVLKKIGKVDIKKMTRIELQKLVNEWSTIYSKNYLSDIMKLIKMVFEYAVLNDILNANPMDKVKKPRVEEKEKNELEEYYTKSELLEFLEILDKHYSPTFQMIFRLLAYTGARAGEILALDWNDIDFNAGTLNINKTLATGLNNSKIIQTPKTNSSKRVIDLDPSTLHKLRAYKLAQKELLFKLGFVNKGYLFVNTKNNHFNPNNVYGKLKSIQKKHKLKGISCHGFRHTHCSLLFEAGASIQSVQVRLGHSDIKTTMNIYNHVTENIKQKTALQFAEYMSI
ncbi:MAG: site-specific integrase [Gemella sp.]|nr:site-specific integrase [Gemella sp.]